MKYSSLTSFNLITDLLIRETWNIKVLRCPCPYGPERNVGQPYSVPQMCSAPTAGLHHLPGRTDTVRMTLSCQMTGAFLCPSNKRLNIAQRSQASGANCCAHISSFHTHQLAASVASSHHYDQLSQPNEQDHTAFTYITSRSSRIAQDGHSAPVCAIRLRNRTSLLFSPFCIEARL